MVNNLRPSAIAFLNKVKNKPVTILEAGVYRGYYSKELYNNFNCKVLYLLDQWLTVYENGKYTVPEMPVYEQMVLNWSKDKDNVKIIKNDSLSYNGFISNSLDYVYLDNDHSYNHCIEEFPKYWDIVSKGGMLSGDNLEAPGVYKALNEFCNNNGINYEHKAWKIHTSGRIIASDWWIWK